MSGPHLIGSSLHWRPRSALLLASGAALAAVAIALRNPVPLFMALPLLLAPVAAGIALSTPPPRLRLSWTDQGHGPNVAVVGVIEGADETTARSISLSVRRPEPLGGSLPPALSEHEGRIELALSWTAPHPCLATILPPDVFALDPLGLAEQAVPLDASPLRVERYPPEATRIGSVQLRRTTPVPGEVRSRSTGRAGEFFSLRPLAPGDSRRQVNWRASARARRLVANEFLADRTGDLVIVIDARPSSLGPDRDERLLSIARAAAHGIATGFLREKARVGVGIFGEFLSVVPLGSGRAQRFRIERFLDEARIAAVAGPDERLAVSLRRYFPPGVSTLLISPLGDEESVRVLPHLRHRGFSTVVLSPSPLPMLVGRTTTPTADDRLAGRLMRLVRRRRISDAWNEAPVLDWEEYWSIGGLNDLFRGSTARGRRA